MNFCTVCIFAGGMDYKSGPYSVTFTRGKTKEFFAIPIIDDDYVVEKTEKFTLIINSTSLPDGVTVGDCGQATATIHEEDSE